MAGLLDEQLAVDSEVFVNSDEHGESVTYTPRGGSSRTIKAVVIRQSPEPQRQGQQSLTYYAKVFVRNDVTYGISGAQLNVNGDTLTVSLRKGGTAKAYLIHLPSEDQGDQDAGMLQLEIRG